jgi:hypothetical protein
VPLIFGTDTRIALIFIQFINFRDPSLSGIMKFFCVPLFGCKYAVVDTLDYSQQHLEDVPKEIYRARKFLEELNLNVNKIESLPIVGSFFK